MTGTYNSVGRDGEPTQGGYSGAIVVDENYVLRIPDALPLDAPRHCSARASRPIPLCANGMPVRARASQ